MSPVSENYSIGFVLKSEDPQATELLKKITPVLLRYYRLDSKSSKKHCIYVHRDGTAKIPKEFTLSPIEKWAKSVRFIFSIGGDGTILKCARVMLESDAWKSARLAGVNTGHLGFLTSFSTEKLADEVLDVLKAKVPSTEERSCIEIRVLRAGKVFQSFHALNDAVIAKGSLSRIFEFHVEVNGEFLSSYRADGLIVASPTGSTAYSLAAGGSIVEPRIPAIQLTPICPQSLSNKPIVLSDTNKIKIRLGQHSSDVFLTIDGQTGLQIQKTDQIEIRKSQRSICFLLPRDSKSSGYFPSLRQKLKWGLVSPTIK